MKTYNTIARNLRPGDVQVFLGTEVTVTSVRRNRTRATPDDRTVTIGYSGSPDRTASEEQTVTVVY
ncbi:MAG: hypothetical protein LC749_12350 [Actinobacteria bacterium]|nr:hypothetical protein [Actinomycetota bacterium]